MNEQIRSIFSRRALVTGLLAAAALALAGCANAPLPAQPAKPLRVLFIGNSYTYVNMLPEMLQQFAIAGREPRQLEYEMIAPGGSTLEQKWKGGNSRKTIAQGGWDYVVLQESSGNPITNAASTQEYVRLFDSDIRKAGAKTLLYVTWARKGTPETQARLTEVYSSLAKELGALCCPVGPARARALANQPGLNLYQSDGSHPSAAGTYLAACVFYNVLYHKSPAGLPATVAGKNDAGKPATLAALSPENAAFLQKTAAQTVKEWKGGGTPPEK